MKKTNLPSIPRIKKALYADWSLRVRTRDGFKCLLCGATENLTAHHWYCCDHHAHAARYAIDNGATLCYACHIRGIHTRADFVSVQRLQAAIGTDSVTMYGVHLLMQQELTTPLLRELWDAMRKRHIPIICYEQLKVRKDGKAFITIPGRQEAVAGNVMDLAGYAILGLFEVTTVAKTEDGYRYTLKPVEDAKSETKQERGTL